jgi:hypothetical protein
VCAAFQDGIALAHLSHPLFSRQHRYASQPIRPQTAKACPTVQNASGQLIYLTPCFAMYARYSAMLNRLPAFRFGRQCTTGRPHPGHGSPARGGIPIKGVEHEGLYTPRATVPRQLHDFDRAIYLTPGALQSNSLFRHQSKPGSPGFSP